MHFPTCLAMVTRHGCDLTALLFKSQTSQWVNADSPTSPLWDWMMAWGRPHTRAGKEPTGDHCYDNTAFTPGTPGPKEQM